MKKFILVCLLQIPLFFFAQTQENLVIQNEEISGSRLATATNSIVIKPTTWIKAGANFTAKILENAYLPLNVSDNENYVLTRSFQTATTSTTVAENGDVIETITYYDGLGRAKQSIGIKQSPTKKDIVTHVEYDELGRMVDEFLPYASNQNNGSIKTGAKNATQAYYRTNYADDFPDITINSQINAFSRKELEASPLNRVLKQAAPGKDWSLGRGHEIEFDYQTNTTTDAVKQYSVTTSLSETVYEPTLVDDGVYAVGELYKTVTKDENHTGTTNLHTTEEFKNKQGQVVLKRTYAKVGSPSVVQEHDTYYIYDDFGNLTYVLPPKVTTGDSISATEFSELGYQYKYDTRNRLAEKKIPGKAWEYIVYDQLDRPVLTQDANLRASNKWLFTKYDALGRVIYTGIHTHSSLLDQPAMQAHFNTTNNTAAKYYESKLSTPGKLGIHYSYNNFPIAVEVLTVNYYDNYTFDRAGAATSVTSYGVSSTSNLKGLATGSKVKVLNTNDWITTVTYYDAKARPIYVYSNNEYLKTTDIVESKIDFVGKVLETKATHSKEGKADISTLDTFEYDHAARLKKQKQKINSNAEEVIVENNYDNLGQLINKEVGGGLQKVDYKYNVRGWLTKINEDASNDNDLFNFTLQYNRPTSGNALFNGNISQTSWSTLSANNTSNPKLNEYTYTYDALNRIKAATGTGTTNYNVSGITYDKNGNILTLKRRGHTNIAATTFGPMDDLVYKYHLGGNFLLSVEDKTNKSGGFYDQNAGNDYGRDANGNMIFDKNKKITNIKYNHLNLPTRVTINGKNIDYKYDAAGTKLSKTVNGVTTKYAGGYIYENDVLQFFNHPEGYVKANVTSSGVEMDYVYQYKDHLGNVRLSYTDNNNDGTITQNEIIEESNYYPFGLKHKGGLNSNYNPIGNSTAQKFGYNGKELNEELGLEWHDFGARNYDASLGRWMNIDPLAHRYDNSSPYSYVFNNPLLFVDPDGMRVVMGQNDIDGDKDLSLKEILGLLSSMQKMTDDQLYYDGKTREVRIKKKGKGKKNEGTKLLRQLIGHKNTLTIHSGKSNEVENSGLIGGWAGPDQADGPDFEVDWTNARNGKGDNAEVGIGLSYDFLAQDFKTGQVSMQPMSETEIMNHEFIHALAIMNGDNMSDKTVKHYYNDGKSLKVEKIEIEEAVTVFRDFKRKRANSNKFVDYPSANTLQKEQGRKKVLRYKAID